MRYQMTAVCAEKNIGLRNRPKTVDGSVVFDAAGNALVEQVEFAHVLLLNPDGSRIELADLPAEFAATLSVGAETTITIG